MKKLNKLKIIITLLILLGIVIGVDLYFNEKTKEKISQIEKEYEKTEVENIYILKKEKINLVIINNKKIKEFKDLDSIGEVKKGESILIVKNGKFGYIESNGEILIPLEYDGIGVYIEEKALAKKDGKIGVIGRKGNEIIPFKYDEIYIGLGNNFLVKDETGYFSYDLKEKKKLETDRLFKINDKLVAFIKENKFGIINYKGEIIVPNEYDEVSNYIDKLFIGYKNEKYNLYNLKNEKVSKEYDFIEQIGNNEYKSGNNEAGNYAFLSETLSTEDKYDNILKISDDIYLGTLKNDTVDMIEISEKRIKNIKTEEIGKYIENIEETKKTKETKETKEIEKTENIEKEKSNEQKN